VKNGGIIQIGKDSEILQLVNNKTTKINLERKLLLPGFIDTHEHFIRKGLQVEGVDCRTPPMKDLNDVITGLKAKTRAFTGNQIDRS
jgi:predicted amidohydrolase YtcJ